MIFPPILFFPLVQRQILQGILLSDRFILSFFYHFRFALCTDTISLSSSSSRSSTPSLTEITLESSSQLANKVKSSSKTSLTSPSQRKLIKPFIPKQFLLPKTPSISEVSPPPNRPKLLGTEIQKWFYRTIIYLLFVSTRPSVCVQWNSSRRKETLLFTKLRIGMCSCQHVSFVLICCKIQSLHYSSENPIFISDKEVEAAHF